MATKNLKYAKSDSTKWESTSEDQSHYSAMTDDEDEAQFVITRLIEHTEPEPDEDGRVIVTTTYETIYSADSKKGHT